MNTEIERRLAADARELDDVTLSAETVRQLEARLAMTRQVAAPALARRRLAWPTLAAVAAGFAIVAVTVLVRQPGRGIDADSPATTAVTVPTPAPSQSPAVELVQPVSVKVPLQRVSHAAPLEAEWVALREDLERTRERIERELPVRF